MDAPQGCALSHRGTGHISPRNGVYLTEEQGVSHRGKAARCLNKMKLQVFPCTQKDPAFIVSLLSGLATIGGNKNRITSKKAL